MEIFNISKTLPREERYFLTDQEILSLSLHKFLPYYHTKWHREKGQVNGTFLAKKLRTDYEEILTLNIEP